MTFRFAEIVGTYRLAITSELLVFIERTFVEPLPVADRELARASTLAEAQGAEIEFTPDGVFISRSGAQEFFRVRLDLDLDLTRHEQLDFEKSPGVAVTVRPLDEDTLIAIQPGRPPANFRRVKPPVPAEKALSEPATGHSRGSIPPPSSPQTTRRCR
ncbi:MAG: hypothetical protein ABIQ16_13175 [Polyangiaceae bacterium]